MEDAVERFRDMPPTRLHTADFVLRAIAESDWSVEAELSRDAEVVRWTFYPRDMDEQAAHERIAHYQMRAAQGATQRFVILDTDDNPLGTCGIGRLEEDTPEVFYALLRWGRGRGAATQAATSLVQWALASGRPAVALVTIDGNEPSERVALRAGFDAVERFEGEQRGEPVSMTRWLRRPNVR